MNDTAFKELKVYYGDLERLRIAEHVLRKARSETKNGPVSDALLNLHDEIMAGMKTEPVKAEAEQ